MEVFLCSKERIMKPKAKKKNLWKKKNSKISRSVSVIPFFDRSFF